MQDHKHFKIPFGRNQTIRKYFHLTTFMILAASCNLLIILVMGSNLNKSDHVKYVGTFLVTS